MVLNGLFCFETYRVVVARVYTVGYVYGVLQCSPGVAKFVLTCDTSRDNAHKSRHVWMRWCMSHQRNEIDKSGKYRNRSTGTSYTGLSFAFADYRDFITRRYY